MVRGRLAALVLVSGLGLVSGCTCFSGHPLFGKKDVCCPPAGGCCEGGYGVGGSVIDENGPLLIPPGSQAPLPPAAVAPPQPAPVPPLAPAPRLVPQPQAQAIPTPYTPQ
jgi:hypothetical protein